MAALISVAFICMHFEKSRERGKRQREKERIIERERESVWLRFVMVAHPLVRMPTLSASSLTEI